MKRVPLLAPCPVLRDGHRYGHYFQPSDVPLTAIRRGPDHDEIVRVLTLRCVHCHQLSTIRSTYRGVLA